MKVIIAGAGLSGMTAAWFLHKKGHEVTVLEASQRVGGRTWSEQLSNGEFVELGGEFIQPTQHLVRQLCAELELPLIPHDIVFGRRWMADGTRMEVEELEGYVCKLHDTIEALSQNGRTQASLDEAGREAFGANYQSNPMYLRMVTSLADDATKVSAMGSMFRGKSKSYPYMEHGARVINGNNAIAQEIHRRIGEGAVRLGEEVAQWEQTSNKVTLTTDGGKEYVGDAAVITVPLPKLQDLTKSMELPALMRDAIDTRQFGVAAKISVAARSGSPSRGVQYPGELWWTWNSASIHGDIGRPAVTGFAGTKETIEKLALQDGGESWKNEVKRYRSDLDLTDEFIVTDWGKHPFTRGAYSAPGVEWRPEFETAFDDPIGRVMIAGEHTTEPTLNGAADSGRRAARTIHAQFG